MIDFVKAINDGINEYPNIFIPPLLILILVTAVAISSKFLKNSGKNKKLIISGIDTIDGIYTTFSSTIIVVLILATFMLYVMKKKYPEQYTILNTTAGAVTSIGGAAVDGIGFVLGHASTLKDGLTAIEDGVNAMTSWTGEIKDGLEDAADFMSNVGDKLKDAANTVATGISSGANTVASGTTNIVKGWGWG